MSLSGSPDQHQRFREVKQGDHICALFVNPAERDVMLHGYVLAGLRRRHKCVIVFDESDSGPLVTTLRQHCAVDAHLASGQLELRRAADTAPPQGWLTAEDMLGLWPARRRKHSMPTVTRSCVSVVRRHGPGATLPPSTISSTTNLA